MELWQILIIILLLFPAFFIANYIIVTRMVRDRKRRDDQIDRAVSAMVGKSMGSGKMSEKFKSKPRYGSKRRSL